MRLKRSYLHASSNMKHPLRILPVFRMKTGVNGKVRVEHFYGSNAVEWQLPIPLTPAGLGKTQRLPTHQHDLLPGGAANTIRMNHARHGLAFQRKPAGCTLMCRPPKHLCDFFHWSDESKINRSSDLSGLVREGIRPDRSAQRQHGTRKVLSHLYAREWHRKPLPRG